MFLFEGEETHLFPTSRPLAFRQPHPSPVQLFLHEQNVIPLQKTIRMEKDSVSVKEEFSAEETYNQSLQRFADVLVDSSKREHELCQKRKEKREEREAK